MFAASDDSAMMKQIQSTHAPDGRVVDVKPILQIIDNVLRHITPNIDHALNVYIVYIHTTKFSNFYIYKFFNF